MRTTKPGQINFTFGKGGQEEIDRDSDPAAVRALRDLCIRWLDEKAAEDAAAVDSLQAAINTVASRSYA